MHVHWHMTSSLFFMGVREKVRMPCLVHKARVVTVLLCSQKMRGNGGYARWFLRRFSVGLTRTAIALGRLRGAL